MNSIMQSCPLQPGDLILVGAISDSYAQIVSRLRRIYAEARTAHVLIAHNELSVIDAAPDVGVKRHFVYDKVVPLLEHDVRIMRNVNVPPRPDGLVKSCAFHLCRPYDLHFHDIPQESYTYCSRLAFEIYETAGMNMGEAEASRTRYLPSAIDKIVNEQPEWHDVTQQVASWLREETPNITSYKAMHALENVGLNLNRTRQRQRDECRAMIADLKEISPETRARMLAMMDEAENRLSFQFWDRGSNGNVT